MKLNARTLLKLSCGFKKFEEKSVKKVKNSFCVDLFWNQTEHSVFDLALPGSVQTLD